MAGGHEDTWGMNSKKHLAGEGSCRKGRRNRIRGDGGRENHKVMSHGGI